MRCGTGGSAKINYLEFIPVCKSIRLGSIVCLVRQFEKLSASALTCYESITLLRYKKSTQDYGSCKPELANPISPAFLFLR